LLQIGCIESPAAPGGRASFQAYCIVILSGAKDLLPAVAFAYLPVFIGQEFWHRLTGQKTFYAELTQAFSEVADEVDGTDTLKQLTKRLAKEIAKRDGV
jgi:hypothetical protein